ncbi:hypothetical protein KO02_00430 [Sphingobacterium sp. ML3W]|nr:hypothetical protein KO02_00430 [Sphingobacterium sp. ML3W]
MVADLERKEVGPELNIGILNIPRKNLAICLIKCKGRKCGADILSKLVAPWLIAKMRFRLKEGIAFLPPDFSGQATFIGWVVKSFKL